jgi:DNA-binding LytR/AlgR family response regulator
MNKLKCLIIDDEPAALSLLEGYVSRTPFLELAGKCTDAFSALEFIGFRQADLLFLDIQMPEFSGVELSRMLKSDVKIIFTTAFQQYAIDGFKVDAIDYLLKPFSYDEFLKAALKAQEIIQMKSITGYKNKSVSAIFVKSEYKLLKVELEKILYIEGFKDYIKIHMSDSEKPILTLMSLKAIEEKLPAERFMRIHRSYIVNLGQIQALERSQVLIGDERITIRDQYIEKLDQYILGRSVNF